MSEVRWGNSESTAGSIKNKLLCHFTACYNKRLLSTVSHYSNKYIVQLRLQQCQRNFNFQNYLLVDLSRLTSILNWIFKIPQSNVGQEVVQVCRLVSQQTFSLASPGTIYPPHATSAISLGSLNYVRYVLSTAVNIIRITGLCIIKRDTVSRKKYLDHLEIWNQDLLCWLKLNSFTSWMRLCM